MRWIVLREQDLRGLLARRTENRNVDYKQSLNWGAATSKEKGAVAKDVLAMSNTQDGGKIVLGVRDEDFEAIGLTESDFQSFDATKFADFVNRYADPPLECGIHKFIIGGKRFVAIDVPEFDDVPIICKADLNDAGNRQILKRGAIYIRTERAASEIVPTAETMRNLLNLAVAKTADHSLRVVERMVDLAMRVPTANKAIAARTVDEKELSALERSYDITLETLGDLLDMKGGSTKGHSRRVTIFTVAIARALGLSRSEINVIARGAFLHDIGKMVIPDNILIKPGPLTAAEFAIVKEHCLKGYAIVHKIPFLADASKIVLSHHERYDGTGYPKGIKETEIPLGARIVAVANTLDSITSDHPYHSAQSMATARAEIQRGSGSQFDPEIVSVFQQLNDGLFEDLRREINAQN